MKGLLKYSTFVMICLGFGLSCKKFVDVDPPIDKTTSELVFSDDKTATSAVLGIYTQMMITLPVVSSGGVTIYAGLSADELYNTNVSNPNVSEFTNNALSPTNGISSLDFWLKSYNIIYQANACIEGLSDNNRITPTISKQLLGEAKFIRAFIYFYLVNFYGDVPLITGTDYQVNSVMSRTSSSSIYQQIVNDLKEAQTLLPPSHPGNGNVRPNKFAATALLARIYLYQQNWTLAENETTTVINSGSYSLDTNVNNVFLAGSSEAIWQLAPVTPGFNTTEARYLIPTASATTRPNYPLTNELLNGFEVGDLRKTSWVKSKTVSGETYNYPFKYKVRNLNEPVTEFYMILRLAEQYLIRAESRANQGKLNEGKADLNIIRNRAGLPVTGAATQIDLLSAIQQERKIELFAEWGHRWLDLKRTGKSDQVLSLLKTGWQTTDTLYPIPLSEIRLNPSLTQNTGY